MGKSKKAKGGNTAKLGAPDHFTGFKLAFLVSCAAMYQQCLDSDTVTGFYDKVTLDFVAKYGQDEPFNKEFADDPPDPEDGIGDDEHDDAPLSKEETDRNAVLFTKLRTVSCKYFKYFTIFILFIYRSSHNGTDASINVRRSPRPLPRRPTHSGPFSGISGIISGRLLASALRFISISSCTTFHASKRSISGAMWLQK
jgi:hypothetical protein